MNISILKGWWKIRKGRIKKRYAVFAGSNLLFFAGQQNIIDGKVLIDYGLFKQGLKKIFKAKYSFENYVPDIF